MLEYSCGLTESRTDFELEDYNPHKKIKMDMSV